MRSLSMLFGLVQDLERLTMAASPFYRRPSMFLYQCPSLSQLQRKTAIGTESAKDGFKVRIDVAKFKPEELKVKLVDNCVEIEGKQEQRDDGLNQFSSHHFVRRFRLPRGCDVDQVVSTLSPEGVLTVSVPKPQIEQRKSDERVIEIQQTGSAHIEDRSKAGEGDPKK